MGTSDVSERYRQSEYIDTLALALYAKNLKILFRGLVGSDGAMVALACYRFHEKTAVFILPSHEEAIFLSDLEGLID